MSTRTTSNAVSEQGKSSMTVQDTLRAQTSHVVTMVQHVESKFNQSMNQLHQRMSTMDFQRILANKTLQNDADADLQRMRHHLKQVDQMVTALTKKVEREEMEMRRMRRELHKIQMGPFESAGREAIRLWLRDEVRLPQYCRLLIENGFDDMRSIADLEHTVLIEIGIEKVGHRRKILKYKHKLMDSTSTHSSVRPSPSEEISPNSSPTLQRPSTSPRYSSSVTKSKSISKSLSKSMSKSKSKSPICSKDQPQGMESQSQSKNSDETTCKMKSESDPKPSDSNDDGKCCKEDDGQRVVDHVDDTKEVLKEDTLCTSTNKGNVKAIQKEISKALQFQNDQLNANTTLDYVFVGNELTHGVVMGDERKKEMFKEYRERATQGDRYAIGRMYRCLREILDDGQYSDYGEGQLMDQLQREYVEDIDWSKY